MNDIESLLQSGTVRRQSEAKEKEKPRAKAKAAEPKATEAQDASNEDWEKRINVSIKAGLHRRLRYLALDTSSSIQKLVDEAIEALLEQRSEYQR